MAPTTTFRDKKWPWIAALVVSLALLLAVIIVLFDWNLLRRPIERRVSAATGRSFQIKGDLRVHLGLKTSVSVDGLALGNVPGAKDPLMASADRLEFRLHLLDLLHHHVVMSAMKVSNPMLLLEKNLKGQPNWIFPHGTAEWPTIQQLQVSKGKFYFRNPLTHTDLAFDVQSGEPTADARLAPLSIDGKGRYAGNPLRIVGRVESPLVLEDASKPYRVDLRAQAGLTTATAKGSLEGPMQLRGFDLAFGLAGPNLALLYPLLGIATPDTPPYHLLGRLTHEHKLWNYNGFNGTVGDSDLHGDATVRTSGPRPFLKANLRSHRLDFDDLGGFIGVPPQATRGETANAEQKAQAARMKASARVLPDDPFHLDKLRHMDADVRLRADHINAPSLPLDAMTVHLFVDDGVLRLDPLDFTVAGGQINSTIKLDARKQVILSNANIQARGLELPKLFPKAKLTASSTGRVGGDLQLSGSGNSVAKMLANSNGKVGLIMGQGRISNLLLEYAGIDIAESLKFLIKGDRTVPVRCAFGDFQVSNGVMATRRLAFDTTDTVILGEGSVSLRDERLDLVLKPQPKDHSLLTLRSPLLVTGTFKDPSFRPDIKKLALRGIAAAVLATLAPPAALIALYERGPGKDISCRPSAGSPTTTASTKRAH